jgi:hypothetical protein
MRVTQSFDALARARFSRDFVAPQHRDWCFSRIPDTLRSLLLEQRSGGVPLPREGLAGAGGRFKKVLFILVDGLGWRFFEEKCASHALFKRFESDGCVAKITSQFPSTTVVHVTSIATGLTVAEAGLTEWFYYEPNVGEVVAPLPFSFAGDETPETLRQAKVDPYAVFPRASLSAEFAAEGVKAYVYQHKSYTPSSFSMATMTHAELVPFNTITEGMVAALSRMERDEKAFHFLYIDSVDSISHQYGPSSSFAQGEADSVLTLLERRLFGAELARLKDTLVVLTADHGAVDVDPAKTIYLDKVWPEIGSHFKKNRRGGPIVPCGGVGRNMFLHVEREAVDEVRLRLEDLLRDRAELYSVEEMVAKGFFGFQTPSNRFYERAGDLVIVPYEGETVWWFDKGRFEMKMRGNHGGLTAREMEIPFLTLAP